ncbi:serine--tRNA ligase [Patescibacteria group bacterium]|nr:serine--tRNA ligase [Patescibacteria group bacterium]MBU2220181.1 serine--tRNA ligase [Patescibacteria group bacterium]MBU2265289.1 serine--tRNA ligase [Patescibacteria group bacterium]
MLDIKFIRDNKEAVKANATNRGVNVDIDKLLSLDEQRRRIIVQVEALRASQNKASEEIAKEKDPAARQAKIDEMKKVKEELGGLEPDFKKIEEEYGKLLMAVPNIALPNVPIGKDENENVPMRQVGKLPEFDFKPKEHWEIGEELDIIDTKRAARVSGARFSYLKGGLALMEFALIQLVFSVVTDENILKKIIKSAKLNIEPKPFIPVIPPVLIKTEPFRRMARLEPREERYYIPEDDLYLIGSAEHTLGALHLDETFNEADLPVRYIGFSTAFRREAGSYAKDLKGILRVHQFDKAEMESFCLPEKSTEEQNLFVAIQEHLIQLLKIPYQVVMICTGDMGAPDARQIDIEAWLPGQNRYRETHTADLMTDYQSSSLNTKVKRQDGKTEFAHMNDATAFAIGRTLIAIMENYQQADGSIEIPKVLQPWMGGIKKIKNKKS